MSQMIQSKKLDRREKTFGLESTTNLACSNRKEFVKSGTSQAFNLSRWTRGSPKVHSFGINSTNNERHGSDGWNEDDCHEEASDL